MMMRLMVTIKSPRWHTMLVLTTHKIWSTSCIAIRPIKKEKLHPSAIAHLEPTTSIPSSLFSTMSDGFKKGWARKDPAKKKAIAAHFSKPAPEKNSEITAHLSDTGYDSEHTVGSKGTYHFASGFDADDDAVSDGGIEAKEDTNPTSRSMQHHLPNILLIKAS